MYSTVSSDLVCVVATEAVSTNALLNEVNSSLAQLESSAELLQANVSQVKERLNQTIHKPNCISCLQLQPELEKVTVDTSVNVRTIHFHSEVFALFYHFQPAQCSVLVLGMSFQVKNDQKMSKV